LTNNVSEKDRNTILMDSFPQSLKTLILFTKLIWV
jgi:hypothetical protein